MSRRFEAVLEGNGPGVVFELPFEAKEEFGLARAPVRVTIDGFTFGTTVGAYSGRAIVGVGSTRPAERAGGSSRRPAPSLSR